MADIYDPNNAVMHPLYNFSLWEPNPPISHAVSAQAREMAEIALQSDEMGKHDTLTENEFWQLFLIDNTKHFDELPKIFFDGITIVDHPDNSTNIAFRVAVSSERVVLDQESSHNCGEIESYGDGWKPLLQAVLNGTKLGYLLPCQNGQDKFVKTDYYLTRLSPSANFKYLGYKGYKDVNCILN